MEGFHALGNVDLVINLSFMKSLKILILIGIRSHSIDFVSLLLDP